MFSKSKLFAAFLLSASACAAVFAQTTPPTAPSAPTAPSRVEGYTQFFTSDDGGYLGVQTQEVTKENFSKFGLREVRGVAIEKVMENSPAAQAGLQNGDVIVRFAGEEVTSTRKLTRLIGEIAPDHQVRLTVSRGGSEREVTVTLGKRPTPKFDNVFERFPSIQAMPSVPSVKIPSYTPFPNGTFVMPDGGQNFYVFGGNSRQIGVNVAALNKQLGDYFGVADGKGLLINNVRENSPAAKAGLKAGDVILEVDGKEVNSSSDLIRAIGEKKEGDVTLTIIRNKNRQTVKVTPEKAANGGTQRLLDLYETEKESSAAPAVRRLLPTRRSTTITAPRVRTITRTL